MGNSKSTIVVVSFVLLTCTNAQEQRERPFVILQADAAGEIGKGGTWGDNQTGHRQSGKTDFPKSRV